MIMSNIWGTLDGPGKNWRQKFKALLLIEFLVKNGVDSIVDEVRNQSHRIRPLTDFSYFEGTKDLGQGGTYMDRGRP